MIWHMHIMSQTYREREGVLTSSSYKSKATSYRFDDSPFSVRIPYPILSLSLCLSHFLFVLRFGSIQCFLIFGGFFSSSIRYPYERKDENTNNGVVVGHSFFFFFFFFVLLYSIRFGLRFDLRGFDSKGVVVFGGSVRRSVGRLL